jgi:hypothetical protein
MRFVSALLALGGLVLAGCAGMNGGSLPQAQPPSAGASAKRPMSASQHQPLDRRVFGYTHHGDIQTFVVPAGVTRLSIDAAGAQGGDAGIAYGSVGGEGGSVQATIPVTPGESLELRVGGRDGSVGGLGFGPCRFHDPCFKAHDGGAGGGASYVFRGAILMIVAGGGGGAGGFADRFPGGNGGAGGLKAKDGGRSPHYGGAGGEGATQTGGGNGGGPVDTAVNAPRAVPVSAAPLWPVATAVMVRGVAGAVAAQATSVAVAAVAATASKTRSKTRSSPAAEAAVDRVSPKRARPT